MKFDKNQFISDYMTVGMYVFNASEIMDQIEIDRFSTVTMKYEDNCFHAEGHEHHNPYQQKSIELLRKDLSSFILRDFRHEIVFDFYCTEVGESVRDWHNDAEYNLAGQNASVNCFFDDTSTESGGRFEMKPYSKNEFQKAEESHLEIVYPKKFDIVIFNQNRNFLHRAFPSTDLRRMVSFGCLFGDFNHILPNFSTI